MSIINFEIEEIKKLAQNVPNSKIIVCNSTPSALVRVDIKENQFNRQLTVILRFPEGYPLRTILIELKSRTLHPEFLKGLTALCESNAHQHCGNPQGLIVLKFAQNYLKEHPLCVCFDEIQKLRQELGTADQLKLKQRTSTVEVTAKGGAYYYRVRALIPDEYPKRCIYLQQPESNLPTVLVQYMNGQSREIARQCVEPPLNFVNGKNGCFVFEPVPSLYWSFKFLIEAIRDFHEDICPVCETAVLPIEPADVAMDDSKDSFVERVYCGHLYHQSCLRHFLQEPPFPKDGKLCPSTRRQTRSDVKIYLAGIIGKQRDRNEDSRGICGIRLAHDRWVLNPKVAETRWAQKQARIRELDEVVEFLK